MCQRDERYLPACLPACCCLVGIFGLHCIAQIPYLLSMLIAQNCTKVLTLVTHRKLAFHMPHTTAATVPPLPLPDSIPDSILRIFQLQFAQLFNDKLPNVSDSTSNYAIVCSVHPTQFPWSAPFEWPSKNVFTIHCSTCLLWLTPAGQRGSTYVGARRLHTATTM